jgi:Pyruvate/2-oxoacid:ferredoxin oxidoreductase delta subunit
MPVRQIIEIDRDLCDGCGDCVTACAEGAIELIDGKATLVSDVYCDGLGMCLGHCHAGALRVVERDSEAFDERAVEDHLARRRVATLGPGGLPVVPVISPRPTGGGCPGSTARSLETPASATDDGQTMRSHLGQWPVQLHLINPEAPSFAGHDVLLAADCVAYAVGGFHRRFLSGKALAIACPKLDSNQEIYLEKLVRLIDDAGIRSLTVMIMEVPCCRGLGALAQEAARRARRDIPVEMAVASVQGDVR